MLYCTYVNTFTFISVGAKDISDGEKLNEVLCKCQFEFEYFEVTISSAKARDFIKKVELIRKLNFDTSQLIKAQ